MMKHKGTALLCAACLAFTGVTAAMPEHVLTATALELSGSCGDSVSWHLDTATGVLSISGSGEMKDYSYDGSPWNEYMDSIHYLELGEGLTAIGKNAFIGMNLKGSITVPKSVKEVREFAFAFGSHNTVSNVTILNPDCDLYYRYYDIDSESIFSDGMIGSYSGSITGYQNSTAEILATKLKLSFVSLKNLVFTVSFAANGGTGSMKSVQVSDKTPYTVPECEFTPPTGKQFEFWEGTDSLNNSEIYFPGDTVYISDDILMTAVYSAKPNFQVSFDPNGGFGTMAAFTVEPFTTITLPECEFEKTGYLFDMWEIDGYVYSAGTEYKIMGNTVCKAKWKESDKCGKDLTWKFETEIGKLTISGTGAMDEYDYADEVPWSLYADEIREISLPEGLTEISALAFRDAGELTAVTIPKSVTKIGDEAFASCKVLEDITLLNPKTELFDAEYTVFNYIGEDSKPVFNGTIYGFAGSTAEQYAKKYNYAFEPFAYPVHFDANGGSGEMQTEYIPYGADLFADYTLPECKFTAPKNQTFKGWLVTGSPMQPGETMQLATELTLTAVWDYDLCTVKYDANGAKGSIADVVLLSGSAFTFPACTFTAPEGKRFAGWQVADKTYQTGESIKITKDTVVKAAWETIQYTITFDANGGTGEMASKTVLPNTEFTFAKCGFTAPNGAEFLGWQVGDKTYEVGDTLVITADTEIKALWSEPAQTILMGDVSGDGVVNQDDAILLSRYAAGWEDVALDTKAADLNDDGVIDNADVMILARYVAGWEGFDQYIVTKTV